MTPDPDPAAPTCRVVKSGAAFRGVQGLDYRAGLTGASAGAQAICMVVATLPPGAKAKAHLHRGIETAAYVIEGAIELWFGPALEHRLEAGAGDYTYIPADMPYVIFNRADRPCVALVAHTAPDDQAGIVLLPELDARVR